MRKKILKWKRGLCASSKAYLAANRQKIDPIKFEDSYKLILGDRVNQTVPNTDQSHLEKLSPNMMAMNYGQQAGQKDCPKRINNQPSPDDLHQQP